VYKAGEGFGFAVKQIQSSFVGADPKVVVFVHQAPFGVGTGQGVGILGIVVPAFVLKSIVAVQSILGSKPQVTFLILGNVVDTIARHISGQLQQIDLITRGELTKHAHCAQTQATEKNKG
jgi:hypothetical protein